MSDSLCPLEPPGLGAKLGSRTKEIVPDHILSEFTEVVVVLPNRLYFGTAARKLPKPAKRRFATLNTDDILVYEPFYRDFGPLNLGYVWRFADEFDSIMKETTATSDLVYYANSTIRGKVENAAFLLGCYLIDRLQWTASEAIVPFLRLRKYHLVPFRDASYGSCTYELSLYACFAGFERAKKLSWFSHDKFDLAHYEKYEQVSNGDLNWIIPGKFVAFSGPSSPDEPEVEESYNHPPEKYVPIFKKWNVKMVIRLNKRQYNAKAFTKHGIKHVDLYFVDGSCPSESIVKQFLKICEEEPGAVAVHCKAGLGRTGTLIGCYAMKHYQFRAYEWIAWNRITRPGSVLGPQQQFLHLMENLSWLQPFDNEPAHQQTQESLSAAKCEDPSDQSPKQTDGNPPATPGEEPTNPSPTERSSSGIMTLQLLLPSLRAASKSLETPESSRLARLAQTPMPVAMSPQEYRVAHEGDSGQGERLVSAKMKKTPITQAETPSTCGGTAKSTSATAPGSPRRRSSKSHMSPRSQFVQKLTDFFSPRKVNDATNASTNS